MKISILALFAILACKSANINKTIKLSNVQQFVTYPGVAGSPISNTITSDVVFSKTTIITFDSFWINGYVNKMYLLLNNQVLAKNTKVLKGQIYQLKASYYESTSILETGEPDFSAGTSKSNPPIICKSPLIIKVLINNKPNFLQISNIKKTIPVYGE